MRSIRHLVLGLDFDPTGSALSAGSARALELAISVAEEEGARVDLVHSIAADRYVEQAGGLVVVLEGLPPAGEEVLQGALARLADQSIAGQIRIHRERPWLALAREAREHGADLVVVGTHDESHERRGLGNVAVKVVRDSPCPVWAVGPMGNAVPRRILATTDLSEVGGRAVGAAAFLASRFRAELHVVHAYQITLEQQMEHAIHDPIDLGPVHGRAEEAVRRQVAEQAVGVAAELHVGCCSPLRGILSAAERIQPDLIVLGAVRRHGLPAMVLGSTAEKILARTAWSVLVVKPENG